MSDLLHPGGSVRIARILIPLLMLLACVSFTPAAAEAQGSSISERLPPLSAVDPTQTGSLTLEFEEPNPYNDDPGPSNAGVGVEVRRVAGVDLTDPADWQSAAASSVSALSSLGSSAFDWRGEAWSDSSGTATLSGVPVGLYLVTPTSSGQSSQSSSFHSFTLTVPSSVQGGSSWSYYVTAFPKLGLLPKPGSDLAAAHSHPPRGEEAAESSGPAGLGNSDEGPEEPAIPASPASPGPGSSHESADIPGSPGSHWSGESSVAGGSSGCSGWIFSWCPPDPAGNDSGEAGEASGDRAEHAAAPSDTSRGSGSPSGELSLTGAAGVVVVGLVLLALLLLFLFLRRRSTDAA